MVRYFYLNLKLKNQGNEVGLTYYFIADAF